MVELRGTLPLFAADLPVGAPLPLADRLRLNEHIIRSWRVVGGPAALCSCPDETHAQAGLSFGNVVYSADGF